MIWFAILLSVFPLPQGTLDPQLEAPAVAAVPDAQGVTPEIRVPLWYWPSEATPFLMRRARLLVDWNPGVLILDRFELAEYWQGDLLVEYPTFNPQFPTHANDTWIDGDAGVWLQPVRDVGSCECLPANEIPAEGSYLGDLVFSHDGWPFPAYQPLLGPAYVEIAWPLTDVEVYHRDCMGSPPPVWPNQCAYEWRECPQAQGCTVWVGVMGDYTRDGIVGLWDLVTWFRPGLWGSRVGNWHYDPTYDWDGDQWITLADFGAFLGHYGEALP